MKTSKLALKLIEECKQTQSKKLDLGNCGLREIPLEIFELTWLEELIISNFYWDYLQNTLVKSKNSGGINFISSLPEEWSKLNRLRKLFIGGSIYYSGSQWNIKSYSSLSSLSSIEHLDLSGNQLRELPKEIVQLTNLKQLDLSKNQFQELPKDI